MKLSASDVASIVGGIVDGDKKSTITKLSKIENGDKNSLSFLGNPKYNEYLYSSNASIIIVDRNLETKKEINPTLIRVQDPNLAFSQLLEYFESKKEDQMAVISTLDLIQLLRPMLKSVIIQNSPLTYQLVKTLKSEKIVRFFLMLLSMTIV